MPTIRPVLVLAAEGPESLDGLGPVEVFDFADRAFRRRVGVSPAAYRGRFRFAA